ncbi:hypothetical protein ACQEVS_09660 [Streptomyces sp. CA-181903]|uniref:hypothetical protein n=1 Tax=Streptomyces sp. CA-181903 TaxID=3240055 RepID=UPI003D8D5FF1
MPEFTSADRALMLLPYEEWISLGEAAYSAGIDEEAAASVVRLGRRRGILRTRGNGPTQQVRRIYPAPRRPHTPSDSDQPPTNASPFRRV